MALFLFTKAILEGRPIDVFNQGQMRRDFTYIDDIVEGVDRTSQQTVQLPGGNPFASLFEQRVRVVYIAGIDL